jgi:hypothetical protein
MILRKITFIIIAFVTLSFISDSLIITTNGLGKAILGISDYESIKLMIPGGKTKIYKGRKKLNGDSIEVKGKSDKFFIRIIKYTSKRQKVLFRFNSKKILYSINIWGVNKYKTDKRIIVGKSTFRDLDSLYGKTTFVCYKADKHHLRLILKHTIQCLSILRFQMFLINQILEKLKMINLMI